MRPFVLSRLQPHADLTAAEQLILSAVSRTAASRLHVLWIDSSNFSAAHPARYVCTRAAAATTVLLVSTCQRSMRWRMEGPAGHTARTANTSIPFRDWVENNGFEPLTPCLQSRCSSQLS